MADACKHQRPSDKAPVTDRVEACLPCQFGRVKCERDQSWTPGLPCKQCKRNGIACTFRGVGQQEFRQSAELAELEVFKTIRVCLVDEFLAHSAYTALSLYCVPLRSAASLRMDMVAPTTKAFLAAAIAASARSTQHPIVIGKPPPVAPSKLQLSHDPQASIRREATCTALANRAIQIASESGALRHASFTQVLALCAITMILPRDDPQRRLLASMRGGHERQLEEDYEKGETTMSLPYTTDRIQYLLGIVGLGWMPFLNDAWSTHEMKGAPLVHTDEMVVAHSESVAAVTGCRGPLDACTRSIFDVLRCSFELLVKAYRLVGKGISPTRSSVSPDFGRIAAVYAALDEAFLLRSHAATFVTHDSQAQFIQANMELAAALACCLTLSVQASLRPFLDLDVWQAQCQKRSLRESRCVVESFRSAKQQGRMISTSLAGLMLRFTWGGVVDCMLGAPVTVSSGAWDMMTWTMAEKTAAIANAVDVMEVYAWSWPETIPALQRLQAGLHCGDEDNRGD